MKKKRIFPLLFCFFLVIPGCSKDITSSHEHSFMDRVVAPTFGQDGYTTHTCVLCGYTYTDSRVEKLSHTYSVSWDYDEIKHWHSCSDVGYETFKSDEDPHFFVDEVTQPTYEYGGYTTHTCAVCGYSYVDNETDPLIHAYNDTWSYNETSHWKACTDSGYESLKSNEAGHTFNHVVTPASFEHGGYTTHTCTICGYSYIDSQTNQLIHSYSSSWSYNETSHFHVCTDLGFETLSINDEEHTFVEGEVSLTDNHAGFWYKRCSVCGYTILKDIVFGKYPQSFIDSNNPLTNQLNKLSPNQDGYYEYDGCEYEKIQSNTDYYVLGKSYYFKVEPIRWKLLSFDEDIAFVTTECLLDKHCFDEDSNNYKDSDIRQWLNNEFLNKAFTDTSSILTTTVDNSVASTLFSENPYACENTYDKVFLLSYEELYNEAYGFSPYNSQNTGRTSKTTAYVRCKGCQWVLSPESLKYNGNYWTRSPVYSSFYNATNKAVYIDDGGYGTWNSNITYAGICVRPCLRLRLNFGK